MPFLHQFAPSFRPRATLKPTAFGESNCRFILGSPPFYPHSSGAFFFTLLIAFPRGRSSRIGGGWSIRTGGIFAEHAGNRLLLKVLSV